MSEKTFDLMGFGDPFLDLVTKIERLPEHNKNCPMLDHCFQGGGNVPTAVVAGARLGLKTALIGSVGDDLFGRLSLSDLAYNGVNTDAMRVHAGKKSNFSICITESAVGGKEFIVSHGDFEQIRPEELNPDFLRSARMLHTGLITDAAEKACAIVHEAGGKVSVDAPYYKPHVYEHYRCFDIFIGSEMYYEAMCGDEGLEPAEYKKNMRLLSAKGPEIVIFTFGSAGCRGVCKAGYFELPAIPVKVADTTGAGDVFHGAFDYAYLQGWDAVRCARFASAVSAIKCTRPGGRAGIPSLSVVTRFLQDGVIDYTEIDERVAHYQSGISI